MERVKVGLLAVIAVALVVPQLSSLVPVAEAQSGGEVTCHSIPLMATASVRPEKAAEDEAANLTALQTFLRAHPGDVVFETTLPRVNATLHLICIR